MEFALILIFITVGIIVLIKLSKNSSDTKKVFKDNEYAYLAKELPMTQTEAEFFRRLNRLVSERYYVFPQVHLSAILDHRIKGQDWNYAFRHINGKSVDFVLCNKETLMPTYAIELDDFTHSAKDRQSRDREVERIFAEADLPLIRFPNKDVSDSQILDALRLAFTVTNS